VTLRFITRIHDGHSFHVISWFCSSCLYPGQSGIAAHIPGPNSRANNSNTWHSSRNNQAEPVLGCLVDQMHYTGEAHPQVRHTSTVPHLGPPAQSILTTKYKAAQVPASRLCGELYPRLSTAYLKRTACNRIRMLRTRHKHLMLYTTPATLKRV
jgi:hypothetical protein